MAEETIIKDGAKVIGSFFGLLLILFFVPIIGFAALFLLPLPMILFSYSYSLKASVVLFTALFFLLFFLIGPAAFLIVLVFNGSGIVIGTLYKLKKEPVEVLVGAGLTVVLSFVAIFVGILQTLNMNPVESLQETMTQSLEDTALLLEQVGETDTAMFASLSEMINNLTVITPFLLIISGIIYALIVQAVGSYYLRRKKYRVPRFPKVKEWDFSRSFLFYYIATHILLIIGLSEDSLLLIAAANLQPLFEIAILIQGFAFIFYFVDKKKRGVIIPVIIVVLSFLLPIILYIIRILGIIDLGFKLRKRWKSQN